MPTKKADKAKGPRKPAGATGEKAEAIVAYAKRHRKGFRMDEAAEACGTVPGRVFEVHRASLRGEVEGGQIVRLERGVYGWKARAR